MRFEGTRIGIRRQGVVVGDEMIVLKLVLQSDPVLEGSDEVTEMQFARWAHPAQNDTLLGWCQGTGTPCVETPAGAPHGGRRRGDVSVHEEVRLPVIVHRTDKMPKKHDMIRPNGASLQDHVGLMRRTITLSIVAGNACGNQILPCISSSAGAGQDVIHRQHNVRLAAVLTRMAVTSQDVLSRKDDLLIRYTNVDRQPHDAGKRH